MLPGQGCRETVRPVMPLHRFPPRVWDTLKLQRGIYARLPAHYLRSLEEDKAAPAPAIHWRPHGAKFRYADPAARGGPRERLQDVPIPVHYPRESQQGLWGGEGWIVGFRYANNNKVSWGARGTPGRSRSHLPRN